MDLSKRIITHLEEFKGFECFTNYEKEIIQNIIDIIKLRQNQTAFIKRCHEDYFLNLDLKIAINNRYNFISGSEEKRIITDFKNILALITAIDLFDDKDLIFTELFNLLKEKINLELDRKNKILINNKKFWEELKEDLWNYWTNTKNDIDNYKNKISIYKFQLQRIIKHINEYDPY